MSRSMPAVRALTGSCGTPGWRSRAGGALAVALLLGGLVAGCGDDGDSASGPSASRSSSTPSPSPSPSPSPASPSNGDGDGDGGGATPTTPFPANTEPDTQQASADALGNITDVRIGHHDGFDRVVLEFDGPGTPGWDVRYVDQPTRQGSGEAVDLPGDAALQVAVTGVGYPPDTGVDEYSGPQRLSAGDTEVVTEVFFDGTFEGITALVVGTEARTPFRVYLQEDPTRIVLEVADAA